ncbi:MAG: GNAT family N-acetyltransferase [Comamonas sp.]|jgi:GNAT superfamily N-acetyltransferase|nr:GNAT family N-acetyltransferase [Comamonas sp.]
MTKLMEIQLRPLVAADVEAVLRIQEQCYGQDFAESRNVFVRRLAMSGHCSWAAVRGSQMLAYLAAYWSLPGAVTPFNGDFEDYADASVLYLHDMAVSPEAAGQGLAKRMVQATREQARARGIERTALVSVQGSQTYWERQGYARTNPGNAAQQQHLASYGEDAVYMEGLI